MRLPVFLLLALVLSGCATTGADEPSNDEKSARINTQLGIAYLRQGELEQALHKLTKALRQDPDHAEAHSAIAVLYERLGELDKAATHFQRSVELSPKDSSALNNFGRFECARGRVEQAEALFRRAAENPLYRSAELPLSNAGTCLLRAGQREKAEQYFSKALQVNDKFGPALLRMAELRQQNGDSLSARGFYQRYLALAPQTPETLWLGIQIERVLGDKDAVASYALLLKGKFPNSPEAQRLKELESNER